MSLDIEPKIGPVMGDEWDPQKDRANLAKHGVSFRDAERFRWETALEDEDHGRDWGETRISALGFISDWLHVMIYAPRPGARRLISLRGANDREVRRYEQG